MRRARKYILRVRPDGSLRVTVPRWGSKAEAQRFVDSHRTWVERERVRLEAEHAPVSWRHGTEILLDGERVTLAVSHSATHTTVVYGGRRADARGHADDVRPIVEDDLRAWARKRLVPRLYELAALHGLTVSRASIRNQRSRWGSCSRTGAIALNFRLVQMPPAVCDYVLLHELMHLKQQNHGRRFWRLVESVCPGFRDAERWLRTSGKSLF
jgi:hypothetical protein